MAEAFQIRITHERIMRRIAIGSAAVFAGTVAGGMAVNGAGEV